MKEIEFSAVAETTRIIFNGGLDAIPGLLAGEDLLYVTDENILRLHSEKFKGLSVITLPAGEAFKQQSTVDGLINEMLSKGAHRSTVLVAVGGGVVTDIAGFAASVFKRGIRAVFVPTTILGMTDAALGGKNGVNVGELKNIVGTTRQPLMIVYDYDFLQTLPRDEYASGFAEIIKHACIRDENMFIDLEERLADYLNVRSEKLQDLIERNVALKLAIVKADVDETAERHLLNFGHSFGHALENLHGLSHGRAIALGMRIAAFISERESGLSPADSRRISNLLDRCGLNVEINIDPTRTMELLRRDKKAGRDSIRFILLERIGRGIVRTLPFDLLEKYLKDFIDAG